MENPAQENMVCMRPVEVSVHISPGKTIRLPRVSNRGNRSVMVLYDFDRNYILTEPLITQTSQELVRDKTRLIQYLLDQGLKHTALYLDNECPEDLQRVFRSNSVDFQLCPQNNHRTNQHEKAIDTWKCHFLPGLSGVDPNFRMHLWYCLLPQTTQTLNLLQCSWINPRISSEDQINRDFYYNQTPMSLLETKVIIPEMQQQRRT